MSNQEHSRIPHETNAFHAQVKNIIYLLAAICGIATFGYLLYDRYVPASLPISKQFEQALQAYHHENRPQAIELAEKVVQQEPTHTEAHKLLASCFAQDGNLQAAAGEYNRAVQISHDDMEAEISLAAVLEKLGSRADARAAYRIVVSHPRSSPAQREIASHQLRGL